MAQFFTVASESVGERRVKFIASTLTVDRHGTKLLPAGCKTENFLKNPVFLACHNRESLDAVLGLVVDIRVTADDVAITVEFDTTPEADKALVRIRKGFLRAVSVGFQPIKQNPEFDSPDEEAAFLASGGVIVISEWELIEVSLVPIGSNPEALISNRSFTVASFTTVRSPIIQVRTRTITNQTQSKTTEPVTKMSNEEILAKLGLAAGAKPEEITAALIKFASGSDPDKEAVITGLLGMLTPAAPAAQEAAATPAPSASSASDGAKAEGMELALKAAQDEIVRMRAEMDEMRKRAEAPVAEDKPVDKSADAEERATKAIKAGQWPMTQRAALIEQYKTGKTPFLFAANTFSTRGVVFTEGGNPTTGKPRIGADAAGSVIKNDVQKAFALAERNIGSSTGVKR